MGHWCPPEGLAKEVQKGKPLLGVEHAQHARKGTKEGRKEKGAKEREEKKSKERGGKEGGPTRHTVRHPDTREGKYCQGVLGS